MKSISKKILFSALLGLAGLSLVSCGESVLGFSAPQGSTLSVPGDATIETTGGSFFMFYDFYAEDEDGEPLNGIEAQILCTECTIRDTAAANGDLIRDLADTAEVSNPYFVETNAFGYYQLVIELPDPAGVAGGQYTAIVSVNIGADSAQTKFTVK